MTEENKTSLTKAEYACQALEFLNEHPCFSRLMMGFWGNAGVWMSPECKHGRDRLGPVYVEPDDPRYKEFAAKFADKDFKDGDSLLLKHEEFFGEPWVFDHVDYGCELDFSVYVGPLMDEMAPNAYTNWNLYHGIMVHARSMEDMLIQAATSVRDIFGDFDSYDSFLSIAERENHEKCGSKYLLPFDGDEGGRHLERNSDYISVPYGIYNRRWLKWFSKTAWCRDEQHWGAEFDTLCGDDILAYVEPVPLGSDFGPPVEGTVVR